MTQLRYTDSWKKLGIDKNMYGYIYYKLLNIKHGSKTFDEFVKQCCVAVADKEWQAIYQFITDDRVNHVFIYNKYRINKDLLYTWKRKVYVLINQYLQTSND